MPPSLADWVPEDHLARFVRDVVDMGTTAELRLVSNILSSVTLSQPKLKYAVGSLFAAGQG